MGDPEPEPAPPPAQHLSPLQRLLGIVALLIAMAAAGYFFYLHQYWPNSQGAPGLLSTFRHLLDFSEYKYYSGNIDWIALAIAAGAAAALILIGYAALACLDLFIPRLVRLALAYVMGAGIVGVLIEIETIFGLHSNGSIVGTIVLTLLILISIGHFRSRQIVASGALAHWGDQRDAIAREYAERYWESLRHLTPVSAIAYGTLLALVAIITLLTFYHGALTPITYWDSLILYAGYARRIFLEKAFPFKAVAQVGIGLGANYPHLYALLTASTATVAGWWSDAYAQLTPPLAGLLSCFLVYAIALRLTRHRLLALALTAIFRAVPYGIAYFIYASDYSFIMLFTAAFLFAALLYLETNLIGYFILATLIPAFAMHINYLMGGLWIVWLAMIALAHFRPIREFDESVLEILEEEDMPHDVIDLQTVNPNPPTLWGLARKQWFWAWLAIGIAVASPWYIRNWVLTGNPVYAFFANLFPNTVNYNQEVMDSAVVEWTLNGDGIGKATLTREFFEELDAFQRAADVRDQPIVYVPKSLTRKLAASWFYWVESFATWKHAPAFIGIAVPGFILFLLGGRPPRRVMLEDRAKIARRRFGWICSLLLVFLLAYHYLLADFYLYQIIPFVVLIPIFGAYMVRMLDARFERGVFIALAIWIAIFPGLPFALMGFKIKSEVRMGERLYSPYSLMALHRVGLPRQAFRELVYGDDVDAWAALNTYGLEGKVLTHENRHLVLDRRVTIVHFDDWEIQNLWTASTAEKLEALRKLGVKYYLFVPNETSHQVNRRFGPPAKSTVPAKHEPWEISALRAWIADGTLKLIDTYGENRFYEFQFGS